jgi:hypothetical protein
MTNKKIEIMMKKITVLLMATTIILSCNKSDPEINTELVFDQALYQNHEQEELKIDTAYTIANKLYVQVVYSGCNSTQASLISKEYFKESFPVQLDMKIKLGDAGLCEKLIHDEFIFDLTVVKERYFEQYNKKKGTILFDIENWHRLVEYSF